MDLNARLDAAKEIRSSAEEALRTASDSLDHDGVDLSEVRSAVADAREKLEAAHADIASLEEIAEARASLPSPAKAAPAKVEPSARGTHNEEHVYRPLDRDAVGGPSYFRDLANAAVGGSSDASERLNRHQAQVDAERRDISTAATDGGGFVPPISLIDLYAEGLVEGRPFADAVVNQPLQSSGMTVTIPRITTAPAAAVQAAEADAVNETDLVEANVTFDVNTIAGQQDVSLQLLERSEPGIDAVIFAELRKSYNQQVDNQLINGSGSSGQHEGITVTSGTNGVTWTEASPTGALLLAAMYDGAQQIHTGRFAPPDLWVMHPRRSAWLAKELSSTFPLFSQQLAASQTVGSQDRALAQNALGFQIVSDSNIVITDGAGTNQDEVYVVNSRDLILMEDNVRARAMAEGLSGTLQVRLQVFANSVFIDAQRYPTGVSVISGTGLVTPSFA